MAYIEKEPIMEFITKGLNNPDKKKAYGHDAIEILTEIEFAPIEKIFIERAKKIDSLVLGEIIEIAKENGLEKHITLNEKAIVSALEKQIPKKPILEYHKESYPKNYGRLIKFLCPNCGSFIVAMYEIDVESGGIRKDLKGCSTCLQAIDFTEYYCSSLRDERRNR